MSNKPTYEELEQRVKDFEKEIVNCELTKEALTKSEAFLNATGQISKVGGWEIDGETKRVFWTKEIYNITEVPNDYDPSLLEEEAIAFFNKEDQLRLEKVIQRAFEHNEPYDMEFQITTVKRNKKWVQAICEPIVVDGNVVKLSGTFQDISERKQAKEAIQRIYRLADQSTELILIKDTDYKYVYLNQPCKPVFLKAGFTLKEVIGRNDYQIFSKEEADKLREIDKQVIKQGKTITTEEEAENIIFLSKKIPLRNEQGKIIAEGIIASDITEHKRVEKDKIQLENQLQQAQKMSLIF